MKLYLTSVGIPKPDELLNLFTDKHSLSVAIIANAWDVYPAERREQEIEKTKQNLKSIGFSPTLLDLKTLSDEKLQQELRSYSLVWVMGGNSLYLNYHIHKSGLKDAIRPLLERGLVYGGESAGAVVACPTLHGVQLLDDPREAPEIIWDGLGLLDFGIVPHWGKEKYADLLQQCKDEMENYVQVTTISDEQVLIINGTERSVI